MLKTLIDPFKDPTSSVTNHFSNPYVSKLQSSGKNGAKAFYGESLKDNRGQWRSALGISNETPLFLEIGCHKGRTLHAMANDYPQYGFLGMDITFKRVVMTAERAEKKNLKNIGVMMCNANLIDQVFAPGELNGAMIFFPDPWPKLRHSKHRLMTLDFGVKLLKVLRPGGFLWLKTDDVAYFQAMLEVAANLGLVRLSENNFITGRYCTTFEEKFHNLKIPTNEALFGLPD